MQITQAVYKVTTLIHQKRRTTGKNKHSRIVMLATCSRTYCGRLFSVTLGKSTTATTGLTFRHCRLPLHLNLSHRKPSPPPICCGAFPIRRVTKALFSTMETHCGAGGDWGKNGSEHTVGSWFAVPELSLRDHRFIVPLDYSSGVDDGVKITVFAREIVGGIEQIWILLSFS